VNVNVGYRIDSQLLLIHKIANVSLVLVEMLQRNVLCLIRFLPLQVRNSPIQISEDFFDTLNRLVVFYFGESVVYKQQELAEPVFDKKKGDAEFMRLLGEIPEYCPFPGRVLSICL
jgi:hypothetical protein